MSAEGNRYADGSFVMHAERRKAKAARQSAGAKKGPKGAADILTKEFLEEKMHHHTQKVSQAEPAAGVRASNYLLLILPGGAVWYNERPKAAANL
jgi:hypothetical protein